MYIYLWNSNTSYIHMYLRVIFPRRHVCTNNDTYGTLWWYHLQTHMDMGNNTSTPMWLGNVLPKTSSCPYARYARNQCLLVIRAIHLAFVLLLFTNAILYYQTHIYSR